MRHPIERCKVERGFLAMLGERADSAEFFEEVIYWSDMEAPHYYQYAFIRSDRRGGVVWFRPGGEPFRAVFTGVGSVDELDGVLTREIDPRLGGVYG